MNTKQIIGLITFGIGIGGVITTAIVGKLGFDHGNRQFANGAEFGIALKEFEDSLREIIEDHKDDSEHNE